MMRLESVMGDLLASVRASSQCESVQNRRLQCVQVACNRHEANMDGEVNRLVRKTNGYSKSVDMLIGSLVVI